MLDHRRVGPPRGGAAQGGHPGAAAAGVKQGDPEIGDDPRVIRVARRSRLEDRRRLAVAAKAMEQRPNPDQRRHIARPQTEDVLPTCQGKVRATIDSREGRQQC